MATIAFEHVTKRFDDGTVAVDDLNLSVGEGEFLILVGPSGCGKTTALRMIAGLERGDEGEIRIGDKIVNDVPPDDRDIAMVFQNYALYPHMTVRQNIAFPLKHARRPEGGDRGARVERRAALGIEELLERKPTAAFGRAAPARGDGPRDRAATAGVSDGRAAVEPRRQAARADARRD